MVKKVTDFDIFGRKFSFNALKDSSKYTTAFGGLLSIIWIVMTSVVSLVIIMNYLDTTKPVVSVNKVRLERPLMLNFTDDASSINIGWSFILFNGKKFLTVEETSRYVTFGANFYRTYRSGDKELTEVIPMNVLECRKATDQVTRKKVVQSYSAITKKNGKNFFNYFKEFLVCSQTLPGLDYTEGTRFKLPFARTILSIYPCSLPDQTQCASSLELSKLQIGINMVVKVANYTQKRDPVGVFFDSDATFYVDIASKTRITNILKKNFIYDDDIGIIGDRFTHSFIDVDKVKSITGARLSRSTSCSKQQISVGLCEAYVETTMVSSIDKTVIKRNYKQFFGVISEIGGFNDIIIYCVWSIFFFYNIYFYRRLLSSQLKKNYPNDTKKSFSPKTKRILERTSPMLELRLLRRLNSQSKIALEVFFNRSPAMMVLFRQVMVKKRRKLESEKKEKLMDAIRRVIAPRKNKDDSKARTDQRVSNRRPEKKVNKCAEEDFKKREKDKEGGNSTKTNGNEQHLLTEREPLVQMSQLKRKPEPKQLKSRFSEQRIRSILKPELEGSKSSFFKPEISSFAKPSIKGKKNSLSKEEPSSILMKDNQKHKLFFLQKQQRERKLKVKIQSRTKHSSIKKNQMQNPPIRKEQQKKQNSSLET